VNSGQPGRALALAAGCDCCADETVRDESWRRTACAARRLSWVSLAWMCTEGAVGLWQGLAVGSAALTGWALGSVVEGLANVIVIWRFTGSRTVSQTAERRAQRGVAVSFWLLAPYIAAESARDLAVGHRAGVTVIGIVLTAVALIAMPLLGRAKRRLGARLGSAATAAEGIQNYLCAAQAAAVLAGLSRPPGAAAGGWTGYRPGHRRRRGPGGHQILAR
jgi:divalent metal cation (Fe/Co/Zn/Cd) transporter